MEPPGIEPGHTACKAAALPLSYGPLITLLSKFIIYYRKIFYSNFTSLCQEF